MAGKRLRGAVVLTPVKKPRTFRAPRGAGARRRLNFRQGGFTGIERKFADFEANGDAFATTWATMQASDSISGVAQGNTESQRVGRVYNITSVHLRETVDVAAQKTAGAATGTTTVRVVIVHDTQTNGAELAATSVMDGGQTPDHLSFRNLQFTKRFRILMDKTITIRPVGLASEGAANTFGSGNNQIVWKFNRTFKKPIKVTCSGTSAAVASITDNSIHVIGVANSVSVTPSLTYQARIRFTG